jgi:GAF domain-containing protein
MNRSPIRIINSYQEDPTSLRGLVRAAQMIILVAVIGITFFVQIQPATIGLAVILAFTLFLSFRNIIWPGQLFTPFAIIIVSVIFMLEGSGIHDIAIIGLASGMIIGGLFLGSQGLIGFGLFAVVAFALIGIAELTGQFIPYVPVKTLPEEPVIFVLIFLGLGLSLNVLIWRLRNIANQARRNELAQISANAELLQLKQSLETRVNQRTSEVERRAAQLEAIASVARSITAVQDLHELLPSICRTVSEQFKIYHTGIFLLDDRGEYAVLEAANSEGGQVMLKRGHRLRVGATGIVGTVAGQGKARIALDVGADAAYFDNPDLPETRSEMALPLIVGTQIVGILDVQSKELGAFKEEDIAVLGTLANQISIAIENARLFSQTKQSLADSQSLYQQFVKQDWARFARTVKSSGYSYDGIKLTPLGKTPAPASQPNALNVSIKIRGLTVGSITIQSTNPLRVWTQSEINLAQTAAERAGLAVENFRLLTEAQRRAAKERTVGEITARIGSSVNVREIIQTAVEELGRNLPGAEVVLQFENTGEKPS